MGSIDTESVLCRIFVVSILVLSTILYTQHRKEQTGYVVVGRNLSISYVTVHNYRMTIVR